MNSLNLALDCVEEGSKVEPRVREQLEEILEEGLESSDPEIARLVAEVKLSRRLNNFRKIDENLEIDLGYITHAEYQLFVDEQLNSQWHFSAGSGKKPIKMSRDNAFKFCNWLSSKTSFIKPGSDDVYYFRLPTVNEAQENLVTGHRQRIFWDFGGNSQPQNRVQLVRVKIQQYGVGGTYITNTFNVFTINRQAQITQWQRCQAEYSSEDLGNNITLDMVAIPGGSFTMGAPEDEKGSSDRERPQHQVTVPAFLMGKYPVTQAQWKAVVALPKVNRDLKPEPSNFKGDNLPVEQVSWYDAVEFCDRLSKYTYREYRLPSEAEWEYACRAGTTTPFHFGETITGELANYCASGTYVNEQKGKYREITIPVGQFPPNAFGLFDMHGNVWEWCFDDWHSDYKGAPIDGSAWFDENNNPSQKTGISVLRGGSWYLNPGNCRSAYRSHSVRRGNIDNDIGFRLVCVSGRAFQ